MESVRIVRNNSVADMKRYGWVVMDYSHLDDRWIGRDHDGNSWSVDPVRFENGLEWVDFNYKDRFWFRCCKPDDLRKAGAIMVPKRNVGDTRN